MENRTEDLPVVRATKESREIKRDVVVREFPLTIFLNSQELITLLCTPENLKNLAVGFLYSEGLLQNKEEIEKIIVDEKKGIIWIEVKGNKDFVSCKKVESEVKISLQEALNLVNELQHRSQLYRTTGGVHSAALGDSRDVLIFSEDIGRHNAIDKIFGECLLKDIQTDNRIIITSGRVSSEILLKVAKRNIPIIISISAPTNLAVRLANKLGITLIGFARDGRINIYTNDWRVLTRKTEGVRLLRG
jgi:FdhD protein